MKAETSLLSISVDELQLGMFIHLEGGWLAHPFPLSSFRLSSPQQIATLRALGLRRVRWSPARSAGAEEPVAAPSLPQPSEEAALDAAARRRALAEQRDAVAACRQQFAEAAEAARGVADLVRADPDRARLQCTALARSLVDKMLCRGEVCVRLLGEVAGDQAALHAVNLAVLALLLGRNFALPEAEMIDLGVGAMLHDVGKLDLPQRLRHRDEHHTPAEALAYQEHVAHGAAAARRMSLTDGARLIVEQHHELGDGSGFPLRLPADRMTLGARIVALVNRYDNLCNPHVASRALTPHEALSLLFAQGRAKFDPAVLEAFVKMMGVYPPGSAVQLTDERFALVVSVNASRPLKPRLLVYDAHAGEALLLDLEREPQIGIRRSVKPLALPPAAQQALSPRPRTAYFFDLAHERVAESAG